MSEKRDIYGQKRVKNARPPGTSTRPHPRQPAQGTQPAQPKPPRE